MVKLLHKPLIGNQRSRQPAGAVLVALIIAIVLIASLGAVLYTLSSSETYGNLSATLSMQAFYTAESGYRYAVSEYRQFEGEDRAAEMADIVQRMEELQDNDMALPGGLGDFSIHNRPYFFITTARANAGDTRLYARPPGEFPEAFTLPDDIWILIDGDSALIQTGNNTQSDPDTVTFRLETALAATVDAGTVVYPAARVSSVDGTTLILDSDVAGLFPGENGDLEIRETTYTYETLDTQGSRTELTGLENLDGAIASDDAVVLRPMARLEVTGETAGGESGGVFGRTRVLTCLVSLTDEVLLEDSAGGDASGEGEPGSETPGGDGGNGRGNTPPGSGDPGWGGRGDGGTGWNDPGWDNPGEGEPGWSDPDWGNRGNNAPDNDGGNGGGGGKAGNGNGNTGGGGP